MKCWKCGQEMRTDDVNMVITGMCGACQELPLLVFSTGQPVVWTPVAQMRWRKCRQGEPFTILGTDTEQYHMVLILQQLWVSCLGGQEWRDVPTEEEI